MLIEGAENARSIRERRSTRSCFQLLFKERGKIELHQLAESQHHLCLNLEHLPALRAPRQRSVEVRPRWRTMGAGCFKNDKRQNSEQAKLPRSQLVVTKRYEINYNYMTQSHNSLHQKEMNQLTT